MELIRLPWLTVVFFFLSAYGWGSLPITSTRIKVPGASLAIRVARVTPFYSTNTLSDPS